MWYLTSQGSYTKSLRQSHTLDYGQPMFLCMNTPFTVTPNSRGAPNLSNYYRPRKLMSAWHPQTGTVYALTGQIMEDFQMHCSKFIPYLWTTDKLLRSGILPPKHNFWMQDQGIDHRQPDPPPAHHQTLAKGYDYHSASFIFQGIMKYLQHRTDGQGR